MKEDEEVMKKYGDIIEQSRPVSKHHAPMARRDRAAQFASFAALRGHKEAIRETARLTSEKELLSEEEKEILDRRFQTVMRDQGLTAITVTYYKKDSLKEGGSYETITGHLEKFSSYDRTIVLGGTVIALDDISAIEGDLFASGEEDPTS